MATSVVPPLPEGFVLDGQETQAAPALPEGFVLDSELETQTASTEPEVSKIRTGFEQGLQGATFGFADEASDRIGAAIASLLTDEKYSDLLQEARNMSKQRMADQMEQHPEIAIPANLLGGLTTGGVGATTKAGTAIANSLRAGGTGARIAKSALAGSLSGAAYGAGTADEGNRLEGAGEGAALGALVGGAIPAVGAAVSSGIKGTKNAITGAAARGADQLDEAASAIYSKSSKAYQQMRDAGVVFTDKASKNIVNQLQTALKASGPLNKRIHGQTVAVMKDLQARAKSGNLGLEELDQFRRLFGDLSGDFVNKSNARVAGIVRNQIDDVLDNLDDTAFKTGNPNAIGALKAGRSEFARARKFEAVSDIVKKSDGDPNYLKRELKKLLDNPKKIRGFNQAEVQALKEASKLSAGEGIMKMLGKFGLDLGNSRIGNTALPVIGGLATGSPVLPTIGTAARYGQKALARGKAENLLKTIEGVGQRSVTKGAITPALSAPAGGVAGTIEGRSVQTPVPQQRYVVPDDALPEAVNIPQVGPQSSIQETITLAAETVGVQPQLLQAIAETESALNPQAQAATSSATGLFQITKPTWKALVNKYGKEAGVAMKDIKDPRANSVMAAYLTKENSDRVSKALGREISEGEAYIAHFMGAPGAIKLLQADDGQKAFKLFPQAAKANKSIFFNGKTPLTVAELKETLANKVTSKLT